MAKKVKKIKPKGNESALAIAYKRSPNVIFRDDKDGDVLIMHLDNASGFFRLDAWAAEVWHLINGNPVSVICGKITKQSGFDPKFVEKEVRKVIKSLRDGSLILEAKKRTMRNG